MTSQSRVCCRRLVGLSPRICEARLTRPLALTKNGLTILAGPPKPDLEKLITSKKITDEEILKILERPLARNTGKSGKNKKKKPKKAKKAATAVDEEEEEDEDDEDE